MSHHTRCHPLSPANLDCHSTSQRIFTALDALRFVVILFAFFLSFGSSNTAHAQVRRTAQGGQYASQELLVKFAAGPNSARAREIHKYVGTRAFQTFGRTGWQRLKIPAGLSTEKALQRFRGLSGVSLAELNYRRHLLATPNDPSYTGQWHHNQIGTPLAWETTTGSNSIVVAVIDSGLRLTHQDIAPNLWTNTGEIAGNGIDDDSNGYIDDIHGWNAASNTGDPSDVDARGHGTHVAGLIGAVGNNGVGVTGVNWNARLMPLCFIDPFGDGYDSDAIECYEFLLTQKSRGVNVRVVNCSWGGPNNGEALRDVIQRAGQAGILTVAAAGNGDDRGIGQNIDVSPNYPASFDLDAIVSVAASDQGDYPTAWTNYSTKSVDLAAPGESINSTVAYSDSAYGFMSGTSMASPIVSGAAALILSQSPNLSVAELKARLLNNVTKLPQWSDKVASGGRLNLNGVFAATTYSISGLVYRLDGSEQVPLAGAKVTISGSDSTFNTDSQGHYSFTGLSSGSYTLTTSLDGYSPTSSTVTLGGADMVRNIELVTQPVATYSITGRVTNQTGTGVADVQIFVNGSNQAAATTNANGQYSLAGYVAGTYNLSAKKSGFTITAAQETPASVTLPTAGGASSPNGTVNFTAVTTVSTTPRISIDDVAVTEGNSNTRDAVFKIRLSAAPTRAVKVTYATANASQNSAAAGIDYFSKSGTLTFDAGQTERTVTVLVIGDKVDEKDELIQLKLSSPINAALADNSGLCTIINDDLPPTISVATSTVVEGNPGDAAPAVLTFKVKLSAVSGFPVKVQVRTLPGATLPAKSKVDYVEMKTTTLTFAPGETSITVPVEVIGDALNEDKERVGLELSFPVNATLGGAVNGKLVVEGSISDDDPKPALSISDVSITEGNSGTKSFNINVTLSAPSGREVTVDFATVRGTASHLTDFTGRSGSLTFAPGQTSKTISLAVKGDSAVEPDEQFTVLLSKNINATLAKPTGVITIINDDSVPFSSTSLATSSAASS